MRDYIPNECTYIRNENMSRSDDARLLDLRALVRKRLERDLRALADISQEKPELSLRDILDEVLHLFTNYLEQDTLLNSVSSTKRKLNPTTQEEVNKLRSIDS